MRHLLLRDYHALCSNDFSRNRRCPETVFCASLIFSLFLPAATTAQNEDFELSPAGVITASNQVQGWAVASKSFDPFSSNPCGYSLCCIQSPSVSELIFSPNGYADPNLNGYVFYSVFGSSPGSTAE